MQSVMGTAPGVVTSTPPDPSQKIPPEARGKVRKKKKAADGGRSSRGGTGGGSAGGGDSGAARVRSMDGGKRSIGGATGSGETGGVANVGSRGSTSPPKDRTFVTSRNFSEDERPHGGFDTT